MKILVVSDTHRRLDNLQIVLERVQPVDMLIHLGDAEGEEKFLGVSHTSGSDHDTACR